MRDLFNIDQLIQAIKTAIIEYTDNSDGLTIQDSSYGNDECDSISIILKEDEDFNRVQIFLPSLYNNEFNSFAVQLMLNDDFIKDENSNDLQSAAKTAAKYIDEFVELNAMKEKNISILIDQGSDRTIYQFRDSKGKLIGLNYSQGIEKIDPWNIKAGGCGDLWQIVEMMKKGDYECDSQETFIKRACDIYATIITGFNWVDNN